MKILLYISILYLTTYAKSDIKYFTNYTFGTYENYNGDRVFEEEILDDFKKIETSSNIISETAGKYKLYGCYKVYYKNSKPIKAESIKLNGYYILDEKIVKDKNATTLNQGTVFKFDKNGRETYSYDIDNGETCSKKYLYQYIETHCYIRDKIKQQITKNDAPNYPLDHVDENYYKDNILKTVLSYENNKFTGYMTHENHKKSYESKMFYDENGIYEDIELQALKDLYQKFDDDKNREKFAKLIKERKEEIKNIPDLNLTLEKQYIEKINKLNGYGGVK